MREERQGKRKRLADKAHGLYANFAEKEKIKGHHSIEGRAVRTVMRALSGWSSNNLSARDAIILSRQGIEDWLKARLRLPSWSQKDFSSLLDDAVRCGLIEEPERMQLRNLHSLWLRCRNHNGRLGEETVFTSLKDCLMLLERRW